MRYALLAALALAGALPASAQDACDVAPARAGDWSAPLDRTLTLHAGTVPLADALERITSAARIRLSYSRDLLPTARRTCLDFEQLSLGEVLAHVLRGTELEPVVAGANHVVLAPAARAAAAPAREPVIVLDRIDVSARAADASEFAGVQRTALDGHAIERQGGGPLTDAISRVTPGVWVWPKSGGAVAQFGSVRGASSFGASAPKLYIDGLEVANPRLLASLDPATVERVEVLRGPQSAALFGADALAGVTQIVTRQVDMDASGARFRLRSGMGVSGTAFNSSSALGQNHGLSAQFGSAARAARLDLAYSSLGEWLPGASQQSLSVVGSARVIARTVSVSGTARLLSDRAWLASSPLLPTPATPVHAVSVDQYTAGVTASFAPSERWLHTLVAGVNGYTVAGAPPLPEALTPVDSTLATAGTGAFRTTLRLTSVAERAVHGELRARVTLSAEHSLLRQDGVLPARAGAALLSDANASAPLLLSQSALDCAPEDAAVRQRSSTGVSTRFDLSVRERVRLSGGLRAEQTTLENGQWVGALLPSFGTSWLALRGDVSVALRAAYGRGIRWPQLAARDRFGWRTPVVPEVQSGFEAGFDVVLGERLSLQVTRFDQLAEGLELPVELGSDSARQLRFARGGGVIENRGWELSAASQVGALSLGATLAFVDSRVREVVPGYAGELRPGDRALGVPARTLSLSAAWTRPDWSAAASVARAFDWIEYDRLALAAAGEVSGSALRDYWLAYPGATRLRAALNRDVGSRFSFQLVGENLLDGQTGEPHNAAVVPGRTLSFAVRTRL